MRRYSPTAIHKYEACPRQYRYHYIDRVRSSVVSSNLVFGHAIHTATTGYLAGTVTDLEDAFRTAFFQETAESEIEYTSRLGPDDLEATGVELCRQFPDAWRDSGLMVAHDMHGAIVERRMTTPLGDGIELISQLDVLAMTMDAEFQLIDIKSPASDSPEGWQGDQLTAYQVSCAHHAETLGIPAIQGVGFMNLLKHKVSKNRSAKGPEAMAPKIEPARSQQEVDEYVQKIHWIDEDIQRGRFPKRSLMAHDTPCMLCEFRGLCQNDDWTGLEIKARRAEQSDACATDTQTLPA